MHALSEISLEFLKFTLHLLPHRLPEHGKPPLSCHAAYVRESQEIEGFRLALFTRLPIFGSIAAKLHKTRLFGMQFQIEAFQLLLDILKKLQSIFTALESDDHVVGKTDDDYFASPGLLPPMVGPEVERVVEVYVGK